MNTKNTVVKKMPDSTREMIYKKVKQITIEIPFKGFLLKSMKFKEVFHFRSKKINKVYVSIS